jgi:hypothetical protein
VAVSVTRRPSIGIAGPPVLWSVHFLFVYVFVSLACRWGWDGIGFLGMGVIEGVVALATVAFGAAITALGVQAWRERGQPAPSGPATSRRDFVVRVGVLMSGLFLASTVLVGLPTLVRPACY